MDPPLSRSFSECRRGINYSLSLAGWPIRQILSYADGVRCIGFNETRTEVLLIQRSDNGVWEPPGGRIDKLEHHRETAIGEWKEEVGSPWNIDHYHGIYIVRSLYISDSLIHLYSGIASKGEYKHDGEAKQVKWFDIDKLPHGIPKQMAKWIYDARDKEYQSTAQIQYLHLWNLMKMALDNSIGIKDMATLVAKPVTGRLESLVKGRKQKH